MRLALPVLILLLAMSVEPVDVPQPRGYVAHHTLARVNVDGRLDDIPWRTAAWTDPFVDIEGDAKPKPRFETRVKMLWDDTYLYVGAELLEPHVWGTLTAHDSVIFRDPDFEVFIDPNGDNHEYYEFEINALGTFWDLLLPKPYKDDGKPVNAWEIPGLKSAVSVDGTLNDGRDTDRGWTVELAFPWSVLGELARRPSPPREGDQWRVNFSRVQWPIEIAGRDYRKPAGARENNWVWSPQHVVDMHRPETWGYVQFSRAQPGTRAFVPDLSWPARQWLMQVYSAQRAYRQAHRRFADTLAELNLTLPNPSALQNPTLKTAGSLFEASVELKDGDFVMQYMVRQDSLLTPVVR
jgi:hypothetical protein